MSPTTILCRLCICSQENFIKLYEDNGQSNEVYEITIKYFDPMLLSSEQGYHLAAICLECWHHINEFHEFQQLVFNAQEKLGNIEKIVHLDEKTEYEENSNGDTYEDNNNNGYDDANTFELDVADSKDELLIYDENTNLDINTVEVEVVTDKDELEVYYDVPLAECENSEEPSKIKTEKHKTQDSDHRSKSDDKSVRKFKCNKCNKEYKFAHGLREHIAKHTEQIIYQCQHCPTKFTMYRNISRHMKIRHPKEYTESYLSKPKKPIIRSRWESKFKFNLDHLDYIKKDENTQYAQLLSSQEHFVDMNEFSQSSQLSFGQHTDSDTQPLEKTSQVINDNLVFKTETMDILENPINDSMSMDEFAQSIQLCSSEGNEELLIKNEIIKCSEDEFAELLSSEESDDDIQPCDDDINNETIANHHEHDVIESKFKCPYCVAKFTWESSVHIHIKRVHPEVLPGYDPNQITKEENPNELSYSKGHKHLEKMLKRDALIAKWLPELECIKCKNTFTSFALLQQHFKENHPDERFNVICCGNKYPTRSNLSDHIQLHLDPSAFRCELCKRNFKDSIVLKKHKRRLHTGQNERPFVCEVCEKKFKTNRELKMHSDLHNTERNHVCKICDKAFTSKQRLRKHEHNAHRKYLCEHCGKYFYDNSCYRAHLLKHDGIEPPKYPCNICGAQLKSRVTLYVHKKALHHDHSTVYVCSECGKVAATRNALRLHKRNVHGPELERKFKCPQCDKAYKTPHLLREHIAAHTGEPLYACPHCPTKIKAYANFQRHLKNLHPKEYADSKYKAKPWRRAPKVDLNLVVQEIVI